MQTRRSKKVDLASLGRFFIPRHRLADLDLFHRVIIRLAKFRRSPTYGLGPAFSFSESFAKEAANP